MSNRHTAAIGMSEPKATCGDPSKCARHCRALSLYWTMTVFSVLIKNVSAFHAVYVETPTAGRSRTQIHPATTFRPRQTLQGLTGKFQFVLVFFEFGSCNNIFVEQGFVAVIIRLGLGNFALKLCFLGLKFKKIFSCSSCF